MARIIPDITVREEAIRPDNSFVVVAPAGAGKTELLVRRYLTLLKDAESLDSIIALTYTKKAAEEMKGRIFSALEKAKENAEGKDDAEKELLKIAKEAMEKTKIAREELLSLGSFKISTFHSFCADLLRSFPEEAGVSPNFKIVEGVEWDAIVDLLVEKLIMKAFSGEDKELAEAIADRSAVVQQSYDSLADHLRKLILQRDRFIMNPYSNREDRVRRLNYYLEQRHGEVRNYLLGRQKDYSRLADDLEANEDERAIKIPREIPLLAIEFRDAWIRIAEAFLVDKGTPKVNLPVGNFPRSLKGTPSGNFIHGFDKIIAESLHKLRKLFEENVNELDETAYLHLMNIVLKADEMMNDGEMAGSLDYVALEMKAAKALKWKDGTPSKAAESMFGRIRHILVDEAQDLSDAEFSILSSLTEGWDDKGANTLFFVGDPKQSIYRFRKANVELFHRLMTHGLPRAEESNNFKLKPLELKVNFRSDLQVLDFVNDLFSEVLKVDPFFDGVAYSGFAHPEYDPGTAIFSLANSRDKEDDSKSVTIAAFKDEKKLYDWFTGKVIELCGEKYKDESVAILYGTRTVYPPYISALEEKKVSLNIIEGDTIESSQPVKYLLCLLKALTSPGDDLNWALILGAPWFGSSPGDLYEISRKINPTWREKILDSGFFSANDNRIMSIRKALDNFHLVPQGRALFTLWEELDGPAIYADRYGLIGVEEARKFFELLESLHSLPVTDLVDRMSALLKKTYSPADPETMHSKVQAMTVHKAKGLEFDHVFVIGLEKSAPKGDSRNPPPFLVERFDYNSETRSYDFIAAPYEKNEISYKMLDNLDKERGKQEFLRRQYVAFTRAKKKLYLLGTLKEDSADGFMKEIFDRFGIQVGDDIDVQSPSAMEIPLNTAYRFSDKDIPKLEPEKALYEIVRASEEVGVSDDSHRPIRSSDDEKEDLRTKGIGIHRLMERLARGKILPGERAVEMWLKENGVVSEKGYAAGLVEEARKAWELKKFAELREGAELIPEWPLEMIEEEGKLYLGRLDLLIKKGGEVHIIDYKTGAPGENREEWMKRKAEEYRPQVATYKKMISLKEGIKEEKIKAYILFTRVGELRDV